jgi:hypothetical protein
MRRARLAQSGLLGLVLALFCGTGQAAERPRDKKAALQAEATKLLQSGQQALAARDFPTAERALAESYLKVAVPQPLYFLALAAAQQGRVLEAQDLLRRFEADAAAEPDAATVAELRRLLDQPTPPHGKVQVLGEPGAIARIDGRLVGALPLVTPALVTPDRPHILTLDARGHSIPATVSVPAGRFVEVRVNADTRAALITLLPAYVALVHARGQGGQVGQAGQAGPLPPELAARLGRALEEGLQAEKRTVLGRELSLARAPQLAGCLERLDCQRQLAEKNDAEGLFQIDVEPGAAAGRYRVRVKLLDTATGDVAAESESDSSEAELVPALQRAVVGAATRVSQRPRGTLAVLTEPPGAAVFLDEKPLGNTPLERVVWAGSHALVLRKPGHEDVRRPLELGDGQSVTVRESLPLRVAEPAPSPSTSTSIVLRREAARGRRPLWRLIAGPLAIGGGLLLSGIAVHGATLPGKCAGTDQLPDPDSPCPLIYSSTVAGSANSLLGLGLMITGAGIGLVAWPGPRIDEYGAAPR